jgi:7-carboxy-7-deazaguanine synthase
MADPLMITEIYASIQGESSFAGLPCTFVRLTGCPLRCRWCDTAYSFEGGKAMTFDEVLADVARQKIQLVELTGGEPLAQKGCTTLAHQLVEAGYKVLIETGGSEDVAPLDSRVHIIMDIKCPGSGMHERNLWSNLDALKPSDEIKFVLADRAD